ncbi:hypothetical protein BH24BAC1_BH24BAC1_04180 [soil metagenome]
MKEKEDPSLKEKKDNKDQKNKKEGASSEKKLVKELTKKISKELDKKMEKVLKQVRKETRRAFREVLEEMRSESEGDTARSVWKTQFPEHFDISSPTGDFTAEEITVDIEPEELKMGDELPVVEVSAPDEEPAPASDSRESRKETPKGRNSRKNEEIPKGKSEDSEKGATTDQKEAPKRRTAKTPKKGSAEREIGTETGTSSEISPKA